MRLVVINLLRINIGINWDLFVCTSGIMQTLCAGCYGLLDAKKSACLNEYGPFDDVKLFHKCPKLLWRKSVVYGCMVGPLKMKWNMCSFQCFSFCFQICGGSTEESSAFAKRSKFQFCLADFNNMGPMVTHLSGPPQRSTVVFNSNTENVKRLFYKKCLFGKHCEKSIYKMALIKKCVNISFINSNQNPPVRTLVPQKCRICTVSFRPFCLIHNLTFLGTWQLHLGFRGNCSSTVPCNSPGTAPPPNKNRERKGKCSNFSCSPSPMHVLVLYRFLSTIHKYHWDDGRAFYIESEGECCACVVYLLLRASGKTNEKLSQTSAVLTRFQSLASADDEAVWHHGSLMPNPFANTWVFAHLLGSFCSLNCLQRFPDNHKLPA